MDELLTLLERYLPGYRGQIKGARDWHLDELEELFGQPLPGIYREFALSMGMNGGPLLAHVRSYEPLEVADIYRLSWRELPPRRFLFVFGDPSPEPQHYWLDLNTTTEDGDCQIVRLPFEQETWQKHLVRAYVSLREMLFVWAMSNVHLPKFPHRARYLSRPADEAPGFWMDAEALAQLLKQLGFTRLPYPQHCLLFERDDAAIELYRLLDGPGFSFQVGVRELAEFRKLQSIIEDTQSVKKW
jgi:hypothetical protein